MHPAIKLVIGLIVFLAGIYWYASTALNQWGIMDAITPINLVEGGITPFEAFRIVFAGVFGVVLIVLGLIVMWIEYEDLKWESKEKKAKVAI